MDAIASGGGDGSTAWGEIDGVGTGLTVSGLGAGVGEDFGEEGGVDCGGLVWAEISNVEVELLEFSRADAIPHPNPIVQRHTTEKRKKVNSDRVNFVNFNISNFLKLNIFNRNSPQKPFDNRFRLFSTSRNQAMG